VVSGSETAQRAEICERLRLVDLFLFIGDSEPTCLFEASYAPGVTHSKRLRYNTLGGGVLSSSLAILLLMPQ
jgi:hypothetical protein